MAKAEDHYEEKKFGLSEELAEQLTRALESGNRARVSQITNEMHAADTADFIESIDHEKRERLLDTIKGDIDPEILTYLEPEMLEEVTDIMGSEQSAEALTKLTQQEAIDIVSELDEEEQKEILDALPLEYREALEEGLSYPENSIGRLMRKKFVSVPEYWNVGQVIDYLRSVEGLPEDFHEVYIVDPRQQPVKAVLTSKIIRNSRETPIAELAVDCKYILGPEMDQEEVAYLFRQYYLVSAPVVNVDGRIIGFISVEDIVDIIEEEAEEDLMLLGGVQSRDTYMALTQTVKRRFPWLWINLLTSFASAFVIMQFSNSISHIIALAALMPVVAAVVGNASMQTLTTVVRSIAKKQITPRNKFRVIIKEIFVCTINGILLGGLGGLGVYASYSDHHLAAVFGAAIAGCFIVAGLVGACVPIIFNRFKIDPAVASSAFVITITDVTSFLVFLGLATIFLM